MAGLIVGIIMFMLLVLAHEFGHFLSAKKSWVKVLEFGIWIPPKVCTLRKDKAWTEYSLNLIPLWWFVRLKWEDPKDTEDFNAKDSFIKAKMWKKIIILLAGVWMNFVVARVAFSTIFYLWTIPVSILPENAIATKSHSYLMPTFDFLQKQGFISWNLLPLPAKIEDIYDNMPWKKIWLQSGDILLSINNTKINSSNLSNILYQNIWKKIDIKYQRNKKINTVDFQCPNDECVLGITILMSWNIVSKPIKFPLWTAMIIWLKEIKAQTKLTFSALWNLWKNLISFNWTKINNALSKLTWPAWAIKIWETLFEEWWWKLYLWFAWMISLALAIFNVLPIPALDWWRLLGVLIQWWFKLKKEKYFNIEWYINLVFFVLLMALWIYILLKDLVRWREIKIPFMG